MEVKEAIIETGKSRFRPIMLTSVTTIAGLAPLIIEKSFQAQFLIPMAISVAYGLMVGTFILLVLIPALLMVTNRIKVFALSFYEGEPVIPEWVEPAHAKRKPHFALYAVFGFGALAIFMALIRVLMLVAEAIVG